jgi:hypothetical protein
VRKAGGFQHCRDFIGFIVLREGGRFCFGCGLFLPYRLIFIFELADEAGEAVGLEQLLVTGTPDMLG